MNRIYRLVFNRALRVWQVTSELIRAPGGRTGAGVSRAQHVTIVPLRWALLCALGFVSVVDAAQAQSVGRIVGDSAAPGSERPTVMAAPNGVPLINITTPSAAGVSRNRYSQLDVGHEGAILVVLQQFPHVQADLPRPERPARLQQGPQRPGIRMTTAKEIDHERENHQHQHRRPRRAAGRPAAG